MTHRYRVPATIEIWVSCESAEEAEEIVDRMLAEALADYVHGFVVRRAEQLPSDEGEAIEATDVDELDRILGI